VCVCANTTGTLARMARSVLAAAHAARRCHKPISAVCVLRFVAGNVSKCWLDRSTFQQALLSDDDDGTRSACIIHGFDDLCDVFERNFCLCTRRSRRRRRRDEPAAPDDQIGGQLLVHAAFCKQVPRLTEQAQARSCCVEWIKPVVERTARSRTSASRARDARAGGSNHCRTARQH
jgi:hypothetical protein